MRLVSDRKFRVLASVERLRHLMNSSSIFEILRNIKKSFEMVTAGMWLQSDESISISTMLLNRKNSETTEKSWMQQPAVQKIWKRNRLGWSTSRKLDRRPIFESFSLDPVEFILLVIFIPQTRRPIGTRLTDQHFQFQLKISVKIRNHLKTGNETCSLKKKLS